MSSSFEGTPSSGETRRVPYAILGAGPAGVQLSYCLSQAGIEHVLLERAQRAGSFFEQFPRHRTLISINKVYTGYTDPEKNLRWDWNSLLGDAEAPLFRDHSRTYFPPADALLTYLADYVAHHAIDIAYGFDVVTIERPDGGYRLTASDGRVVTCERLVIATGLSHPYIPDIPGIEHAEPYTSMTVDPMDFAGQRVLIIGKGNSAFETADNLVSTTCSIHLASPSPLKLAWQTHFVGHLRAVNNNFLDTYQLKSQNAVLDAQIQGIERVDGKLRVGFGYTHADGEIEHLEYDRVLLCAGFQFDGSIFADGCRPALRECGRLPQMTSSWESPNQPGLYFAGVLMQYRDYKRYMSAFIHGFRYNVRSLCRVFQEQNHHTPWPERTLPADPDAVSRALLERINRSSALWQQPGFLVDVVRLGDDGAAYLQELSADYAREVHMQQGRWLQLSLEYGTEKALNPFAVQRIHREDVKRAADSQFLHPIVRLFEDGVCTRTHHMLEDLAAEWAEPEHTVPLLQFVRSVMDATDASAVHLGPRSTHGEVAADPA